MTKQFVGARVRLKTPYRMMTGWRSTATLLFPDRGIAIKGGYSSTVWTHDTICEDGSAEACDSQWAVMRDQTPNPEHADAVSRAKKIEGE
jgi:hypothetical protein